MTSSQFAITPRAAFDACMAADAREKPATLVTVYTALAMFADADRIARPSVAQLAHMTGMSERSVQRCIQTLVGIGVIVRKPAKRRSGATGRSLYVLLRVPDPPVTLIPDPPVTPTTQDQVQCVSPNGATRAGSVKRRPLEDAFALALGYQYDTVPQPMWKVIGKALSEIRQVAPAVSPDEIREACERYARQHPGLEFGPMAVAKWWPAIWKKEKATGASRIAEVLDGYQRPGAPGADEWDVPHGMDYRGAR